MARGEFPRSISLGGQRARGWIESEVDAWIRKQIANRDAELLKRPAAGTTSMSKNQQERLPRLTEPLTRSDGHCSEERRSIKF
jgi:hypothetical protein